MKDISNTTAVRISKAIFYIEENLDKKLTLEEIATKAYFSAFHFHRLFKIVTKETINEFITRKRIERAAHYLLHQKDRTITEVSEKVGFTNLSSFSRAFKKFYGISPAQFSKESTKKYSKICKTESKKGQIEVRFEQYISNINNALNWIKMKAKKMEVKVLPEMNVAYISHQGKMDSVGNAYDRLMKWAAPKGLMSQSNLRMMTIYHDSPKITDPNKIRMSACMILNEEVEANGEINLKVVPSTKCIVAHLVVTPIEFQQAWESSFVWMSENGYRKADRDPFEIYYNNGLEHPEEKWIVDLCIPVE